MQTMPFQKYKSFSVQRPENRSWPDRQIEKAPKWVSVDLRDGNQSLVFPMSVSEKIEYFDLLTKIGFKEIEVGFPSASQTEYNFLRELVSHGIPDDVTIQILTQAREHLIKKSFEALRGVKRATVHFYNSTSELQRRVVFKKDKQEIIKIAVSAARLIKKLSRDVTDTEIVYQYSPESFSGTEVDFAVDICEAVMDEIRPTPSHKMILNLPATVEMYMPHIYADVIELFTDKIGNRDSVIISTHNHNDRGTAVASTELALLAGTERVEGTLFGNGERTGNADLVTLALNLMSQGIDPGLDFSHLPDIVSVYERINKLPVHPRHPYAGELVYTAFSGSHQDAINKGMKALDVSSGKHWEVPYLPIDPHDVGRTYESIIRINSQSGKGGIAYIMEKNFGYELPKAMHAEFGAVMQGVSDATGKEIDPDSIMDTFRREYLENDTVLSLKHFDIREKRSDQGSFVTITASVVYNGNEYNIEGEGNGPIDAFSKALKKHIRFDFQLDSYFEHALKKGSDSRAVSYVGLIDHGKVFFGAGEDNNISLAPVKALVSALNRALKNDL